MLKTRKQSAVWDHFSKTSDTSAKCNYCSTTFSIKGASTSNLLRYLHTKHSSVNINESKERATTNLESQDENSEMPTVLRQEQVSESLPSTSTSITTTFLPPSSTKKSTPKQSQITSHLFKAIAGNARQKIDLQLVKMIAADYQPFSIVESKEFQNLLKMFNPSYTLPSRKTVTNNLLPLLYNKVAEEVRAKLQTARAVTVTTDGWTSMSNESYIAVTVHFIDEECTMRSFVLSCFCFKEKHTAAHLGKEVQRVLNEWEVGNKVVAIVTDNAANIKAAVRLYGWKHIPCYAHTLNLIVQAGLKAISATQAMVKAIVSFFKRSPQAASKLKEMEKQMGFNELTLKQDVVTRCNSTYDMFERLLEVKEPVVSTLANINPEIQQLNNNNWEIIKFACKVLKSFAEITVDISAEKNVTISKLIVLSQLLSNYSNTIKNESENDAPEECKLMITTITEEIKNRFLNMEDNALLAEATFLDPRFKKQGFQNERCYEKAKNAILQHCNSTQPANRPEIATAQALTEENPLKQTSIWDEYDKKSEPLLQNTNITRGISEINRYVQEPLLKRSENPNGFYATIIIYGGIKENICTRHYTNL